MKAVLVFCEGRHDAVFARRSLGAHRGCRWVDKPIGELPSPFGPNAVASKGLIAARYERQSIDELPLRAAAHAPLPCFESIVENVGTDTVYFMVRANGKSQSGPVLDLLRDIELTISQPPGMFDVTKYAAAFLFDANSEGVTSTLSGFRRRFDQHFGDLTDIEHGKWLAETTVPVGCFVFHESAENPTGTIEHHLAPMVENAWPDRYAETRQFVEANQSPEDKVFGNEAKQLKAVMTVSGQFNHPGDPMTVIIDRDGIIPTGEFENSNVSANLAEFLSLTPWNDV